MQSSTRDADIKDTRVASLMRRWTGTKGKINASAGPDLGPRA